ncbi:MAG TPA: hypothetical protein VF186_10650 [Gaiellaceae bacterium]|jgi:hypothetical protein
MVEATEAPTRGAVFEPLVAFATARTVALVESGELARDDGAFLLRALFDLECDGAVLFGPAEKADADFYRALADYVVDRIGPTGVEERIFDPASAEAAAAAIASEGGRVAQLLGLPGAVTSRPRLDSAVLELVNRLDRR